MRDLLAACEAAAKRLRAVAAEDRRVAEATSERQWASDRDDLRVMAFDANIVEDAHTAEDASHIARHDPHRVLRDVAWHQLVIDGALRTVQEHRPPATYGGFASGGCAGCGAAGNRWPCPDVRRACAVLGVDPEATS